MVDFLIVSRSGRALAASAKRAGYTVSVADCFVDEDTRSYSESLHQLQYHGDGFAVEPLLTHIDEVISHYPNVKLVIGAGFDSTPELIDKLGELAPVIGNNKETIVALKDPTTFFHMLDRNFIQHPDTSLLTPTASSKYLMKRIGGTGGDHVKWNDETNSEDKSDCYFQEFISGVVSSVVFLANGTNAIIVGFNQQLQSEEFVDMPFLYLGAMSSNVRSEQHRNTIQGIINKITIETNLKGLCGLDYIIDESGEIVVLEVNPRPPATFELHEDQQSLFEAHLACFDGLLIDYKYQSDKDIKFRGYAILYTKNELKISNNIDWPLWVKDRPSSGTIIPPKFPVCTVHAKENSIDMLKYVLTDRLERIESTIVEMQNAA